ncbi:hypothetical protein [Pseudoalteromonas galatheae]|uniref:hypothetical protein n=1 Tax=Pseudoalteromonas galatheae TaxID=579562 RepID=UPI0030CE46F2
MTDTDMEGLSSKVTSNIKLQDVTDKVLANFLLDIDGVDNVEFLAPPKSAEYRTLWITESTARSLVVAAKNQDRSENTIIYTAIKRSISSS